MKKRKELLVIDMQKGSFTKKTPRFDTEGIVERINKLANGFPLFSGTRKGLFP